ncbi:hypothetical protein [Myxococcus xanthus]|uniref:hypothetical protein n=1 Tax=Myxococcus xanthus TaxID=34 RepID=UPI001C122097|nr:hypothetical protein [Myxococcus xanthus]
MKELTQAAAKGAAPPPADLPPGVSAALWKLSIPASLAPTPERVLLGEKLFNGKARCNACHAGDVVFVDEGHRVFHAAQAIGGTVGISCDMSHPDASNTHPETYPKYQVQLGRWRMVTRGCAPWRRTSTPSERA